MAVKTAVVAVNLSFLEEGTFARECKKIRLFLCIVLAYPYLCTLINKGNGMFYSLLSSLPLVTSGIMTLQLWMVQRQRPQVARRWLLWWGVVTTILYGCHYVFFQRCYPLIPVADTFYVACNLLVYPLFLLYISSLTDVVPLSSRRWCLPLVVGVPGLLMLICGALYVSMSIGERGEFVRYFIYSETDYSLQGIQSVLVVHHHLCRLLFVAEVFVVFGWGVRKVRRFNHFVSTLYADPESRMLYQVDRLLQLLVLTSVLSVIFNYVGRVVFVGSLWLALPSVLFTILIFLLFFQGMQNRVSMSEMIGADNGFDDDGQTVGSEVTVGHDVSDESVTEPPSVKLQLRDRFEQLMDKEQLYLISDLKVSDVATHLGTNRTYLLNMLATEVGMTFSEYVNRRRIAYAKELMAKNPQMTKIQVAVAAGYSTPSSFYRNYQRYN